MMCAGKTGMQSWHIDVEVNSARFSLKTQRVVLTTLTNTDGARRLAGRTVPLKSIRCLERATWHRFINM